MLAEFSSPPPEARLSPQPQNTNSTTATAPSGSAGTSKKRKRGGVGAALAESPAPSDSGTPEVLTSRTDLFSRPQLNFSRGPIFIPISEGSVYHKTDLVGVNRVGFRYVPAGIKSQAQTTETSPEHGPIILFRTIESHPASYRISWEDRSPFIHVTRDGLGLLGSKGHRSARGNAPVRDGKWYMEVKILCGGGAPSSHEESGMKEGSHVRLGWGRREAPLNGPVGLDGYSYGYRDKTGEKVTLSRPRPYGKRFGVGDVIGMYISLPKKREADERDETDPAHLKRERIAIDFKGQEMFEMQEYPQSKEMAKLLDWGFEGKEKGKDSSVPSLRKNGGLAKPNGFSLSQGPSMTTTSTNNANNLRPLPTLPGSLVAFFVNGQSQGVAFRDIYDYLQLRQSVVKFQSPLNKSKQKKKKLDREKKESHKDNPFDDGSLGYYPFISLFNNAEVRINPGPDFEFPPPKDIDAVLGEPSTVPDDPSSQTQSWRPISLRYPEYMAEQWDLDAREELEAIEILEQVTEQERVSAQREKQREKQKKEREKKGMNKKKGRSSSGTKTTPKAKSPSVGPGFGSEQGGYSTLAHPTPSPLRQASVSMYEEYEESPAATPAPTPAHVHAHVPSSPSVVASTPLPMDLDYPPQEVQETPTSPIHLVMGTPGPSYQSDNGDGGGGEDREEAEDSIDGGIQNV